MEFRSSSSGSLTVLMTIFVLISTISVLNIPSVSSDNMHIASSRLKEPISFTNVTDSVGLSGVRGDSFAWGDYNNDGYQDLLVKGSQLFRNNGPPDWDFTEVTQLAGLDSSGYAVWGDYNNDGYLDFYSAGNPRTGSSDNPDGSMDTLWRNNGPPYWTFTNATAEAGDPDDGYPSLAAGWGDYDRDGYIDLYVVNWRDLNDVRYPDVLWHNNGDGTFTDVTVKAGIDDYTEPFAGMGVNWGDYNDDGWLDIYVSNYLLAPNFLWHNNGDGTFTNRAFETGTTGEESGAAMQKYYGHTAASSWGDYDNDGDLDLWQTNLAHKDLARAAICADTELLRNDGPSQGYTFTNVRDETGIPTQPPGGNEELFFGCAWGDYDNDGDLDIWVPQIKSYIDYAYSYFFRNNGDGTFTDVSDETGVRVWDTDGGSWCDYNNDGFLDLITEGKVPYNNGTYEVRLYRSNGAEVSGQGERNWLSVELTGQLSNTAAIGARVTVTDKTGRIQVREVEGGTAGHSYQPSLCLEFGFGTYSDTVDLTIRWPTGKTQELKAVRLNQKLAVIEPDTSADMVISGLRASKDPAFEGERITLYAEAANWGKAQVDSCRVRFFDGKELDINDGTGQLPDQIGDDQIISLAIDPGASSTVSVRWDTSGELGDHTIWAWVDDVQPGESNENNNIRSFEITINPTNKPPEPVLIATPTIVELSQANIEFDAGDSSDDGEIIEYFFDFGDGDNSDWIENDRISHRYVKTGTFIASLAVADDMDTLSETAATVIITVTDAYVNEPPRIRAVEIDPDPPYAGESAEIRVDAVDPDDDIVEYLFKTEYGRISGTGSEVTWHAPSETGEYRIDITVRDSADNIDNINFYISVIPVPVSMMRTIDMDAAVQPSEITADGADTGLLTATVEWTEGGLGPGKAPMTLNGDRIEKVTADLSELGGTTEAVMRDDGRGGDIYAGDGIYSVSFSAEKGSTPGKRTVMVSAELEDGRIAKDTLSVTLIEGEVDDGKDTVKVGEVELPGFEAIFAVIALLTITILRRSRSY